MNKLITSLLVLSVLPLAACTKDAYREPTHQNPLIFKYSQEVFPNFEKTSSNIYTHTDADGNTISLNVSPKNNIRAVYNNSTKYKTLELCQAKYTKILDELSNFVNNSNEHSIDSKLPIKADVDSTAVRYGSNMYTVTKSKDCYKKDDGYIYFATIVNNGMNGKSIGREFADKMTESGDMVYESATTPSSWLTFPKL